MHMPEMDGFEFIEHIKGEKTSRMAAIMMLTSGGQRNDVARCKELGVSAYLLKPVRQAELREAIERVLSATTESRQEPLITTRTLVERRGADSALSVLLAEDNEVNQRLLRPCWRYAGTGWWWWQTGARLSKSSAGGITTWF